MDVDNIINYMSDSLQRHRGCDLLDMNPGAGLWSRKLHEALQPRKHILMEKDATFYAPFLADLTAKPNVHLLPKSGISWADLHETLQAELPHQTERPKADTPERNDTLLVSVNIGFHPRKRYVNFDCVSDLILFQFLSAIRTGAMFQKYGLVRMLIWIHDDGKRKLIPRSAVRRKRAAFDAELACDWIHEIAGKDLEVESDRELRDEWLNMESGYNVLSKMKQAGLTMPSGRETFTYKRLTADQSLAGQQLAGINRPILNRPFREELLTLENQFANNSEPGEKPSQRLSYLRYREKYDIEDNTSHLELIQLRDRIHALAATHPDQIPALDAEYNARAAALKKNVRKEFSFMYDNYHLFRQPPEPALFWDRRPFEPLHVTPADFFPNADLALLDIQPRAMHPLLRDRGVGSSLAANTSDILLRHWFSHVLTPVTKALDGIWPGAGDLAAGIPSLRDPARGGSPLTGEGELVARAINAGQWADIMQAFMDSPFRPSYAQLVGRLTEESEMFNEEDDGKSAMGSM